MTEEQKLFVGLLEALRSEVPDDLKIKVCRRALMVALGDSNAYGRYDATQIFQQVEREVLSAEASKDVPITIHLKESPG